MTGIRLDRVTAGYHPAAPVLRDLSVTAPAGRMLAVTGASGAGKTTLLRVMAGLLPPYAGRVADGSSGVILLPQDAAAALVPVLTAAENLRVALLAAGHPAGEAGRRTVAALARLGLTDQADQLVEELSGGQQQRALMARGLALAGPVLLADEVTSELDAASRERVLGLLRAEADRGAAVVFATHDPDAAAAADAALYLADGRATFR